MNLAYKFPIIFWNCACLITNSGSIEDNDSADYGKIATAIGETIKAGINISLVDINRSGYSFEPDIENNQILFGMKALSNVGTQVIEQIISNRPYTSFNDFLRKCPLGKPAMFSLIKSGAFDQLEIEWAKELNIEPRILIMVYYISKVCEPKNRLTLQNFNGLIQRDLIPQSLDFQKRVYLFNKYLKTRKLNKYYIFDEVCEKFYSKYFNVEKISIINGLTCILQTDWDKIYNKEMDTARDWLKENQETVLKELNQKLFLESWNKYATGTISAWEMESLCFYYHEHELENVDIYKYGISNFFKLPEKPQVDYFYKKNGKEVPVYRIYKIIGTVISKNDSRSSISLLTTGGVVNVKFTKEFYALFNRQISELQADGTKKVKEKSWMTRGTKVMVSGFRQEDTFVCRVYTRTGSHRLYKIEEVYPDGTMKLTHERYGQE